VANMLKKKFSAFTLVELLVVISIISLLMGVMMPAFCAARAQARSALCRSNLRQLVAANIGYTAENSGFFVPAASDMWNNSGYHRWHGSRNSLDEPFDCRKGPLADFLGNGQVKQCPSATDFVREKGWAVNFEQGCGGYGYNMAYLGSRLWQLGYSYSDKQAYSKTTAMSEVAKPAETLMFADTGFYQQQKYLIEYSFAEPRYWVSNGRILKYSEPSPSLHFRHADRVNVGWVDGHVDSRPIADYPAESDFSTRCRQLGLGWFEPADNTLFDLQ